MSRTDQHIGLTSDAIRFLNLLRKNETKVLFEKIILLDRNETLTGCVVYGERATVFYDDEKSVNEKTEYTENIQSIPWSSGPMYFTCINKKLYKKSGQIIDIGNLFTWVLNPMVKHKEFDKERGHFYI